MACIPTSARNVAVRCSIQHRAAWLVRLPTHPSQKVAVPRPWPRALGRVRWQLDRTSDAYTTIFDQRTVCERVNSQAVELGIERPKLHSQPSITNQNTLLYVLLKLQTLQPIAVKQVAQVEDGPVPSVVVLAA